MITTRDLDWLSAILEGEGSFLYSYAPRIRLSMTDYDVIAHAARIWSGKIRREKLRPNRKQVYSTSPGRDNAGWMMTLYHLMHSRRRAQIVKALGVWRAREVKPCNKNACPRGHSYRQYGRRYGKLKQMFCTVCMAARTKQSRARRRTDPRQLRLISGGAS